MRTKISVTGREAGGFTLIEILVVVTILAILAGAMVPRMSRSLEGRELREAAAGLAHTMQTAHTLAMARQMRYAVGIDVNRGGWTVMELSPESNEMKPVRVSWLKDGRWAKGVRVTDFRTPQGGDVGRRSEVHFYPDGTSNGAKIKLQTGTEMITLIVHQHNGRVVYDVNGNERFAEDQYELGD